MSASPACSDIRLPGDDRLQRDVTPDSQSSLQDFGKHTGARSRVSSYDRPFLLPGADDDAVAPSAAATSIACNVCAIRFESSARV